MSMQIAGAIRDARSLGPLWMNTFPAGLTRSQRWPIRYVEKACQSKYSLPNRSTLWNDPNVGRQVDCSHCHMGLALDEFSWG